MVQEGQQSFQIGHSTQLAPMRDFVKRRWSEFVNRAALQIIGLADATPYDA